MKYRLLTAIALTAMAVMACDEDTATIGTSLTSDNDKLVVSTQNFGATTRSVAVDSVFARERQCYFGRVKDPETNAFVQSTFTTQFNMMETLSKDLPDEAAILSSYDGKIAADSCFIQIFFDVRSSYGDTLAAMKLRVSELDKPIEGTDIHYTNFDPRAKGYIREDGLRYEQMFTLRDLNISDSLRNLINTNLNRTSQTSDNGYYDFLKIRLNQPYTDKQGTTYNNYGTYMLRNFYEHPEYFKNSYNFIHKICPGFLIETSDGIGVMAKVLEIDMYTYFRVQGDSAAYTSYLRTASTEEVVQTSCVTNDPVAIRQLVDDESCTYLKTPAGIFTEVTLPVDEICQSHPTDSLLSAKVIFQRENNRTVSDLAFSTPANLLLIEKDSLDGFFVGNSLYNNKYAYETALSSNAYTYSNISNIITRMYNAKVEGLKNDPNWLSKHPNWNKALLVPVENVTITTTSSSYYSSSSSQTVALKNQMGLTSTRLIRGTTANPINIEVIYAKFRD